VTRSGHDSPPVTTTQRTSTQVPLADLWDDASEHAKLVLMAPPLSDAVREALGAGHLAHLVTVNEDASAQVSIVWVRLEDDEIVSAHLMANQRKVANVRRDPRVVLSLETGGRNQIGLDHYLVVHGRARVTEGGAPELLQRLAHVYLGSDVVFPPMPEPPPGVVLRIAVERVGGVGPWAG
jgi:PPOX class probable F420-dependent enzyme